MADIGRIADVLERHGDRFIERCFTKHEQARATEIAAQGGSRDSFLAKRWAAKEACAKALGTGIADGLFLSDIGVVNDAAGAPSIELTGEGVRRLKELTPGGMKAHIHVSLSDEPPFALAFVVISATPAA